MDQAMREKCREAVIKYGSKSEAARQLKIPRPTLSRYCMDLPGETPGRKQGGTTLPAPPPSSGETVVEADPIERERDRIERLRKLKAEQEAIRAIAGERSLRSHLTDLFQAVAPVFPAPPPYQPVPVSTEATTESLLLHLSDWHAYEEVKPERVMGLNAYTSLDLGQRVRRVVETTASIKSRMERGGGWRFPRLVVAANGDFVSGTIHEVEKHSDAQNVVLAVYGAGMVLATALRDLAGAFSSIEVFCTSGNHGRLPDARRMQMKEPLRNWDTLVYLFAQTALVNVPNIRFIIPDSYTVAYTVENTRILQTHGHDIKSWNSIPFYGINRYATNLNALMAAKSRKIDAFMLGHFHSLGSIEAASAEYFVNGSLIGGTDFSVNGLGRCDSPKQWMLGIHPEHGITHRWPILAQTNADADAYDTRPWDSLMTV
jgi:hypothetical protein